MPEQQTPKPVKAESQMRTWLAVFGAGLLMLIAGRGTYWEPFGQLGLFLTVVGIGGALWLLAKGRDERQQ